MWIKYLLLVMLMCSVTFAKEMPSSVFIIDSNVSDYKTGTTICCGTNDFVVTTKDKQSVTLMFPDKTTVRICEESKFIINQSTVDVDNLDGAPQTIKIKTSSYVVCLIEGSADFSIDKSSLYIHTPKINLTTLNGSFKVMVQNKSTTVINSRGTVSVLGLIKKGKDSEIGEKTIGFVTTYVPVTSKESLIVTNKTVLNLKEMDDEEVKQTDNYFQLLNMNKNKSLFVVIGGRVIGIKVVD